MDRPDSVEDFFGPPISVYTDEQAVEDGVLVDISNLRASFRGMAINRMTRHAYDEMQPFLLGDTAEEKRKDLASTLRTKIEFAYYKGDIWHLPPRFWLIENEVGGWTMMFPEDY